MCETVGGHLIVLESGSGVLDQFCVQTLKEICSLAQSVCSHHQRRGGCGSEATAAGQDSELGEEVEEPRQDR